jgi:hypothetical protein
VGPAVADVLRHHTGGIFGKLHRCRSQPVTKIGCAGAAHA